MVESQTAVDNRIALLAGASGLVGRSSLALLLESPCYWRVHILLRRTVPDLGGHRKRDATRPGTLT